jgi:hypothetical protein
MNFKLAKGDNPAHVVFLALSFMVLAFSFIMSTNGAVNSVGVPGLDLFLRVPCLLRLFTGFNCPACGLTRCFIYMSHFQPAKAYAMNHAGPILYALCVFEVPYRAVLLIRGRVPFQKFFGVVEATLFVSFVVIDLYFFFAQFARFF